MPLPTLFANNENPAGPELDGCFNALGALTGIPCVIAGTNTITLTPNTVNTPTVSAYSVNQPYVGIAGGTNTGPATGQVGSLAAINVYKDTASGPVLLEGGEIRTGNFVQFIYDSSLNSGAGGLHLVVGNPSPIITPTFPVKHILTTTAQVTFSALNPGTSQDATVALLGCSVNDIVGVGLPSSMAAGILLDGRVLSAGVVLLRATNATGSSTITPPTVTYRLEAVGYT